MARRPYLPAKLRRGVFSVDEAERAGLERWHLAGKSWKRLGPRMYIWKGLDGDPRHTIDAARRRLPAGASFSGLTAAWLHGLDVPPCDPIEATVPAGAGVSARAGMAIRRAELGKGDVVTVQGMPATSMLRTVAEVCSRLSLTEAVVIADAALHTGRVRRVQLESWAAAHAGGGGVRNLRRVLDLAEPAAESPMESRLRMVLMLGGLPRPEAQVPIRDRWGRTIGRPDLYYSEQRLGIEYDGGVHRDSLAEDNRRQNRLLNAGVRLLRFTAADVLGSPESVVSQVAAVLAGPQSPSSSAGARGLHLAKFDASAGGRG